MKSLAREEIILKMKQTGFVPLFSHPDFQVLQEVLKACYAGGARFFEFTLRGTFPPSLFEKLIAFCASNCPEMILGVGSVTDAATASLYMNLGAKFVVTPVLREDIALVCNRRKTIWIPGCGSLTEISRAEELGADIVKLFPADTYGPKFIKAIKGPCPWTSIMPTGGVLPQKESIESWLGAGAVCVGLGSAVFRPEIINKGNYAELQSTIAEVVHIIREYQKHS